MSISSVPSTSQNTGRLKKRLYAVKEAAVYLGRSEEALREMMWAGKIPFVQDGRRVFFDINDMDAWIEQKKICGSTRNMD